MDSSLLANIPLFAHLDAGHREELASLLRSRRLAGNEPLFWVGERGDEFFIVEHGQVVVAVPDETGREVTLAKLGNGQFFGEISLLDGGPRTATVRAVGEVDLLVLTREDFHHFIQRHPPAAVHMLTELGRRQRETVEKLRGIPNENVAVDEQRTRWQRAAERVADASASRSFVLFNLLLCAGWVLWNALDGDDAYDPRPFETLGFILGLEGLFISLFVLISQNIAGDRDRIRADVDHRVNVKAQYEVIQLHRKLDRMQEVVEGVSQRMEAMGRDGERK